MLQTEIPLSCPRLRHYPEGFHQWFKSEDAQRIWRAFESRALRMARTGRERYSARTIIETIRWHSDLRDGGAAFKISNNWVPGLAREWMNRHGKQYPNFFLLHDSLGRRE